ncbi:hypothetical protein V7152_09615 [Neobacillus drentensis]
MAKIIILYEQPKDIEGPLLANWKAIMLITARLRLEQCSQV